MHLSYLHYLLAFASSLTIVVVATPFFRSLALTRDIVDAPDGLRSPLLAAQLPRLQGLLTAARGGDPEPQLRHAINALGSFGAIPDQARTQHALASWLHENGRSDEAQPLIAGATATYQQLGANAWLTQLSNLTASPTANGALN